MLHDELMACDRAGIDPTSDALFAPNSLAAFWQPRQELACSAWTEAAAASVAILPGGPAVWERSGWRGLMKHVLGEGQFGAGHPALRQSERLYYRLKPVLPRRLALAARRRYRAKQTRAFPLGWPIEPRYIRFLYQTIAHVAEQLGYSPSSDGPASELGCRDFWPEGAGFAFVLTHDVETRVGHDAVLRLAALDERYGFRSSFNFVPEGYAVDGNLLAELRSRGFEVGVHGLQHDPWLFSSERGFARRVGPINEYLHAWEAVGFRAPYHMRNAQLMQSLDIEYDASYFDTDPYEPIPGGTMSIWPFVCGRFIELPFTLTQDHTLLILLGERTPRLWLEKVDFIARWGGMVLLNVHPDYMLEASHSAVYEAFLDAMAQAANGWAIRAEDGTEVRRARYWHALPRDVARWWRARQGV